MALPDWVHSGNTSEVLTILFGSQHHHCLSQETSYTDQGRASNTRLKGVSVARRNRVNPPDVTTVRRRASPAWAPRHKPTSWAREHGVHSGVEAA